MGRGVGGFREDLRIGSRSPEIRPPPAGAESKFGAFESGDFSFSRSPRIRGKHSRWRRSSAGKSKSLSSRRYWKTSGKNFQAFFFHFRNEWPSLGADYAKTLSVFFESPIRGNKILRHRVKKKKINKWIKARRSKNNTPGKIVAIYGNKRPGLSLSLSTYLFYYYEQLLVVSLAAFEIYI